MSLSLPFLGTSHTLNHTVNSFGVWLLSLTSIFQVYPFCNMYQKFTIFIIKKYSIVQIVYICLSIGFCLAFLNICIHVLVWTYDIFVWHPRSGTAELHGKFLNYLRNCQIVFQGEGTILHSRQQCVRIPLSPCHCQHLVMSVLWGECG